jgi:hypothetical protein
MPSSPTRDDDAEKGSAWKFGRKAKLLQWLPSLEKLFFWKRIATTDQDRLSYRASIEFL